MEYWYEDVFEAYGEEDEDEEMLRQEDIRHQYGR
jgi:hypothetical protein